MDTKANRPGQVGVVIPSYKEADNIKPLVLDVRKWVPDSRIIVVDDSPDLLTVNAVNDLKIPGVNAIHRDRKDGRGSAVFLGMKLLLDDGCEQIVEMDSDFSHPPSQLPSLLAHARTEQLGMLIGSRYLPDSQIKNWPLARRIFSKCSNLLARTVLQVPIVDYTNGYRVYSRAAAECVVETCNKLGKGFIPLSEVLVNLYYRSYTIAEVPTIFTNRLRGESSVTSTEIKNALVGLFRIYLLKQMLKKQRKNHD